MWIYINIIRINRVILMDVKSFVTKDVFSPLGIIIDICNIETAFSTDKTQLETKTGHKER